MKEFKIDMEEFKAKRPKLIARIVVVMLIFICLTIIFSVWVNEGKTSGLGISIPVLFLIYGFVFIRFLRRTAHFAESYALKIGGNMIAREHKNAIQLAVPFSDIAKIEKFRTGSFLVTRKNSSKRILIPGYIHDRETLEEELKRISPIVYRGQPRIVTFLLTALVAGSLYCIYTVKNIAIMVPAAVILFSILFLGFVEFRSKRI